MEVFNLLRSASWDKPTINFNELRQGEHPVHEFFLVNTRYGVTLKADLGDKQIFLPKRFAADMTQQKVMELNTIPQLLVYKGKDYSRNNL